MSRRATWRTDSVSLSQPSQIRRCVKFLRERYRGRARVNHHCDESYLSVHLSARQPLRATRLFRCSAITQALTTGLCSLKNMHWVRSIVSDYVLAEQRARVVVTPGWPATMLCDTGADQCTGIICPNNPRAPGRWLRQYQPSLPLAHPFAKTPLTTSPNEIAHVECDLAMSYKYLCRRNNTSRVLIELGRV